MKRPWLYYFSPCIIASVICLIGVITGLAEMKGSGGWSFLLVILFGPAILIFLVADLIVKSVMKERVLYIWLMEMLIVAIIIICYAYKQYF